jgi:competence protein ComEA
MTTVEADLAHAPASEPGAEGAAQNGLCAKEIDVGPALTRSIFSPMPTPSEQKALAFVAIVILLGGAVRVVRAGSAPPPTQLEQQALARQATAAESAAAASKHAKGGKGGRSARVRPAPGPRIVGGVQSIPYAADRTGLVTVQPGFNGSAPPSPRIDTDVRGVRSTSEPPPAALGKGFDRVTGSPLPPVDLDVATEHEIDALPRIGPTMAHRIVANRDSFGPFGSVDALRRVKGLGPATLQRLVPLVTFSGRPSSRR